MVNSRQLIAGLAAVALLRGVSTSGRHFEVRLPQSDGRVARMAPIVAKATGLLLVVVSLAVLDLGPTARGDFISCCSAFSHDLANDDFGCSLPSAYSSAARCSPLIAPESDTLFGLAMPQGGGGALPSTRTRSSRADLPSGLPAGAEIVVDGLIGLRIDNPVDSPPPVFVSGLFRPPRAAL
jgi:hypothetical protein